MRVLKAPILRVKKAIGDPELLDQLRSAVEELELKMRATIVIKKAHVEIGFGVDKTQRGIAVDSVISIAKTIKSLKGW